MKSKFMRKAAAVVLAASFAMPWTAVTAAAAQRTNAEYIEYAAAKSTGFLRKYRPAVDAVAQGMFDHEASIDIRSYDVPVSYAQALRDAVAALYPDLFFVKGEAGYGYSGSVLTKIVPGYTYDKETSDKMLEEFYAEADFYLDQVSEELSACRDDFSKAMVLHDELILDAHYQYDDPSHYNFMIKKYGLCENYSRVYAYLLSQVGIYSEIVDSASIGHEWVKIKIGDYYYLVDVTWDDPTPDRPGQVSHTYFLISDTADSKLQRTHTGQTVINSSVNTKYDSFKFHDFNSKMCKINAGETAVYAADTAAKAIVKYNYVTNTYQKIVDLGSTAWSAGNGYYWEGIYSGVGAYDGKIYYNTPSEVYCYDPSSGTTKKVYGNSYSQDYYGLHIRGNQLYGIIASDPNSTGTEVLLGKLAKSDVAVTSISISNTSLALDVGQTSVLSAAVSPSDATNKNITWSSNNKSVATVENGKVTAVGAGTACITAASYNGKTAVCTVTVTAPEIQAESIKLSKSRMTLQKGDKYTLSATVLPENTTDKTVTWTTSDKTVATVSKGVITAVGSGTCTISAKTVNGLKAKATITVVPVLNNTSVITNDVVQVGDKLRIAGSANGGSGNYTYAYYFRRTGNAAWKTLGTEFTATSSVAFQPTAQASYDVKVIVKDGSGLTAEKTFTVQAVNELPLTNVSAISRTSAPLGTAIKMTGKAVGGSSPYTYAFYFKRSTNTNWKVLGEKFSETATARVRPTATGSYDFRVIVKDSTGKTETKLFTVTVE